MPLIVSISGIRGVFGDGLDAATLVRFVSGYGAWLRARTDGQPTVVVGRDGRVTGDVCARLVTATLQSVGCHVIDAGLATTPTVEMGVTKERADGGIILSASHNPAEWNALKLLNERGEFLSAADGQAVIDHAESGDDFTVAYDAIGSYRTADFLDYHIEQILELPYIDPAVIAKQDFEIVVDGINSVGSVALPALLKALGVRDDNIHLVNGEVTGRFAHPAEPLPEHLAETTQIVADTGADLGLVVDPDADRLALIADGGTFFGEERTQVVAADFLMRKQPGPFATNLSSSRLIEDIMAEHGQPVHRSAVGEVNVVEAMRAHGAVLGGEGNGGVILPALHYGRDALAGAALVLQFLAETGQTLSEIGAGYPDYHISKNKLALDGPDGATLDAKTLLAGLADRYADARISTVDGVKLDFDEGWVHLRTSNTEPIIRIYTEARTRDEAEALAARFKRELLDGVSG